jgi:hypothetical protein
MSFNAELLSTMSETNRVVPRIDFEIRFENTWDRPVSILIITGDMFLQKSGVSHGFGSLNPLIASAQIIPQQKTNFMLCIDLDNHQLEAVENMRNGGDVLFLLSLHVFYVEGPRQGVTTLTYESFKERDINVVMPRWGSQLRIPQSEWVKMLDEMGFQRLKVFELPIQEPPQGTAIDTSFQHLKEALKSFNDGDYDDVLVNCRKAVEEIENKIDFAKLLGSESKSEKVEGIEKKVKDFLSLGPHPGVSIDRRDAEMALSVTTSFVRYVARQLSHPS